MSSASSSSATTTSRATSPAALKARLAGRVPARIYEPDSIETSVAVILAPYRGATQALLIQRAERAGDPWSGHMALPGGRREKGDADRLAVAMRETEEEVGLKLRAEHLLGGLDDLHPRSPRLPPVIISPFVFWLARRPAVGVSDEVAGAHWVSLASLFARDARAVVPIQGEPVEVPCFRARALPRGRVVWGLTYRILSSLRPLLQLL